MLAASVHRRVILRVSCGKHRLGRRGPDTRMQVSVSVTVPAGRYDVSSHNEVPEDG